MVQPTVDHIVPKIKNGSENRNNLHILCWPCNRRKHTKSWELFLALEKPKVDLFA
jgi:5-methylcytosine-specific restriction endonuclease McrA